MTSSYSRNSADFVKVIASNANYIQVKSYTCLERKKIYLFGNFSPLSEIITLHRVFYPCNFNNFIQRMAPLMAPFFLIALIIIFELRPPAVIVLHILIHRNLQYFASDVLRSPEDHNPCCSILECK